MNSNVTLIPGKKERSRMSVAKQRHYSLVEARQRANELERAIKAHRAATDRAKGRKRDADIALWSTLESDD